MHTEKFCLQWNGHSKILVNLLDELLGKESLLDVTLAAEGRLIRVHRLILCACSPYFEAMLTNENCRHAIVFMKDVQFSDLKALVDFMYKGEVTVEQDQLASFMSAAESLQIKGLADKDPQIAPPATPPKLPKLKNSSKKQANPSKPISDNPKVSKKTNGIPADETSAKAANQLTHLKTAENVVAESMIHLQAAPLSPIQSPANDYAPEPQLNPPPSAPEFHFIAVEAKMETDVEDDPDDIQVEPTVNQWPFRETAEDWGNNSNATTLPIGYSESPGVPNIHSSSLTDGNMDNQGGPSIDNSACQLPLNPAESEAMLMSNPSGTKSFPCQLCPYHTDRKFNLKLHLRRRHKMAI